MPLVDPSEILIAGSLIDVAVTGAQAGAVVAQIAVYDLPRTPCRGLDSWRIPPRDQAFTDSNAPGSGPLEVHFHYVPEEDDRTDAGHVGLEISVFQTDGSVTDSQDFG